MASVPSEGPTGCQSSGSPQAERTSSTTKASKDSPSSGGRQSPSSRSSTREGIEEGLSLTSASVIARRLSRRSVKPVTPVLKRRRSSAPMVNAALKGTVTHHLPPEAMGGRRASADACLRPKNQSGVNAPKSNTSYSVESSAQRLIEGSGMINSGKLTRTSSIPMRFSLTR